MYRHKTVTVVIPAYNVDRFIGAVIKGIPDFVDQVIVVDDAATDDTAGVLRHVDDHESPSCGTR